MSDDSEALIREIEEEVRRDKLLKLWNQYGTYAVAGVAAIVLLVGGWQWYSAYQRDLAQKAGGQYQEAITKLEGDKKPDGLAGLEQIAKSGTPAYAALAKLRLAAEHKDAGKSDEALKLYQAVSDDSATDQMLRSFASLQIASLKVDDGSWTEVQNRLNDLADESSPWRYTARELLGLAAYKHKRWADAQQAYTALLSDPGTPQDLKVRAQTALALITREDVGGDAKKPAKDGAVKTDLKNDKSAGDAGKSTAGGDAGKSAPANSAATSNGAGATNDADKKK
jgi:hypothetical protein